MTNQEKSSKSEEEPINNFLKHLSSIMNQTSRIRNLFLCNDNDKSEREAMYLMGFLHCKIEHLIDFYNEQIDEDEDEE